MVKGTTDPQCRIPHGRLYGYCDGIPRHREDGRYQCGECGRIIKVWEWIECPDCGRTFRLRHTSTVMWAGRNGC